MWLKFHLGVLLFWWKSVISLAERCCSQAKRRKVERCCPAPGRTVSSSWGGLGKAGNRHLGQCRYYQQRASWPRRCRATGILWVYLTKVVFVNEKFFGIGSKRSSGFTHKLHLVHTQGAHSYASGEMLILWGIICWATWNIHIYLLAL